ncbi:transcriptional regulator [Paenibacillus macquariensis subsp. defensor]|nr:transcriptional regulator [Paenibacillus macquariensis subsp. defensor]
MAFSQGRCLLGFHLKKNHMTQQDLANKTGYTRHAISHYVNNRSYMSPAVMRTIAKFVRCHMEELYEWDWSDH